MDDLNRDYEGAGFSKRFGFGQRPALILVDFVQAYFATASPLYAEHIAVRMTRALNSALRVRAAARAAGVPVIVTTIELTPAELSANLMFRKTAGTGLFEKGSPLTEFATGLRLEAGEILINKHYASAFFATALQPMLRNLNVDSLIITGLSTSGCVRATVVDSVSYGYIPIVVREGVADRDLRPHEASLFDIDAKYGDVIAEAEVLEYLQKIRN